MHIDGFEGQIDTVGGGHQNACYRVTTHGVLHGDVRECPLQPHCDHNSGIKLGEKCVEWSRDKSFTDDMGCKQTICGECIKTMKEGELYQLHVDDDGTSSIKPAVTLDSELGEECPMQAPCDDESGLKPGDKCVEWSKEKSFKDDNGCDHTICSQCMKIEKETDINLSADADDITGDFDHTNLIAKPQDNSFNSVADKDGDGEIMVPLKVVKNKMKDFNRIIKNAVDKKLDSLKEFYIDTKPEPVNIITGDFDHTNLIAKPEVETFGSIDSGYHECPMQAPCDPKTGLKPGDQCVKW